MRLKTKLRMFCNYLMLIGCSATYTVHAHYLFILNSRSRLNVHENGSIIDSAFWNKKLYRAVGLRKQAKNVLDCCLLEQNTVTIFVKIYLNRKFKAEKKVNFKFVRSMFVNLWQLRIFCARTWERERGSHILWVYK